jgi:arginine/lysine/ornithine decarboxylase
MNKHNAPLFERLIKHAGGKHVSLHVPGHKSGQGLEASARPYYEAVLQLDVTEISGLDDLHHPEEAILEAQRLAADCFGAEETYFLVNGSTVGNLAMILSVCRRGELLLVQRDVHKSVIHGLMLAGARAVFLNPEVDPETGLTLGLQAEAVEQALGKYPEAKGLLVTRPSYYGTAMPLEPIVRLLHDLEKPLLVDEAHGAHFGFHPALPQSALSYGADAVVQSTHKLLTSMTMGAMLHVQGDLIERKEIKLYLTMLQSSSPSYPLMASLDLSRMQMHTKGEELLEQGIAVVKQFKLRMRDLSRFKLLTLDEANTIISQDPFKVILKDREGRMSGFELKDALEARGCFVELADPQAVLLVFSLASTQEDVSRLIAALEEIGRDQDGLERDPINSNTNAMPALSYSAVRGLSDPVSFDEHVYRQKGTALLPLEETVGQLSAEMIVPYPPGIPVLCPGERISEEVVRYLNRLVALGARIHGMTIGEVPMLPVLIAVRD